MSHSNPGNFLINILKQIFIFAFKCIAIVFAWACKLTGQILLAIGEEAERKIMK
jgi:hypothetical protein